MKVSLDGGITYSDAPNGVRVIYTDMEQPEDDTAELHFNFTEEGLIIDAVDSQGEVIGTSSETADEIIIGLVGEHT